jgi:hypothetical protein
MYTSAPRSFSNPRYSWTAYLRVLSFPLAASNWDSINGRIAVGAELENRSENCGSLRLFRLSLDFPFKRIHTYPLFKILHGLENSLRVLDPFTKDSLQELGTAYVISCRLDNLLSAF